VTAAFNALYRLLVWVLRLASRVPGLRSWIAVESSKGVDSFRISLGTLFCWKVAVNPRKGSVAGSVQIDSEKRWGPAAIVAALLGAFLLPSISSVVVPLALIAVAVGLGKGMFRGD
jgi:hypothetical protein